MYVRIRVLNDTGVSQRKREKERKRKIQSMKRDYVKIFEMLCAISMF